MSRPMQWMRLAGAGLMALGLQVGPVGSVAHAQDSSSRADAEAALEAAYQKEVAYLVAEKRELDKRLESLKDRRRTESSRADASIAGLQGRVLGLERRADQVERSIDELADATIAAGERAALLESTVQQARDALGIEIADDISEAAQLEQIFAAARTGLAAGRTIDQRSGAFFLPDGTQVEGTIVQVGQIAAYGLSDDHQGPLLPLGGDRMMLRAGGDASGAAAARAVAGGERPDSLGVFLIESLDKAVSERTERTVYETIQAGGVVAWVIVGLGVLAMVMSALRALLLAQAGRGRHVADKVLAALSRGALEEARAAVAEATLPIGRVLRAVLSAEPAEGVDPRESLQDVAAAAILDEQPTIERFGALILVVAAVAPLLGLLGTVTGMIATFEIITELGTGDPAKLSGGIGEALITTQLGLVVAIPAVLLGNVLKGRQEDVLRQLDHAALEAVNRLCDAAVKPDEPGEPDTTDDETINEDVVSGPNLRVEAGAA